MGSRIYTRTGDKGQTTLVGGKKIAKNAARVEAYGSIDETNSWIGAALAFVGDDKLRKLLTFLQHRLYNCSSSTATDPASEYKTDAIKNEDIKVLEDGIDFLQDACEPINCFVLPSGTKAASLLHVARTVCRRAERRLVELSSAEEVDADVVAFINRASDLLFAASRYENQINGNGDIAWDKDYGCEE